MREEDENTGNIKIRIRMPMQAGFPIEAIKPEAIKPEILLLAGLKDNDVEFIVEPFNTPTSTLKDDYTKRGNALLQGLSKLDQSDQVLKGIINEYNRKISDIKNKESINEYQKAYIELLKKVKEHLVNHLSHDEKTADNLLDEADQLAQMQTFPAIQCTVSKADSTTGKNSIRIRMDIPQPSLHKNQMLDYLRILKNQHDNLPVWYTRRSKAWQERFKARLEAIGETRIRAGEIFLPSSSVSSGSRNHWMHVSAQYTYDEQALVASETTKPNYRFRSSHVASRPFKRFSEAAQIREAVRSMRHVTENSITQTLSRNSKLKSGQTVTLPFLAQTLITPMPIRPDDYTLDRMKHYALQGLALEYKGKGKKIRVNNKTIFVKLDVINTNHALNYGRLFTPVIGRVKLFGITIFAGTKSAVHGYQLIERARKSLAKPTGESRTSHAPGKVIRRSHEQFMSLKGKKGPKPEPTKEPSSPKESSLLKMAINAYESVLDSSAFLWHFRNDSSRELILASLEQIIVSEMGGIAYGSCISGKDRKGIETIHTDALLEYFNQKNKLPDFSNKNDVEIFNQIFADIFLNRHDELLAGINAPGANGIKSPESILPKQLQKAIKNRIPGGSTEKSLSHSSRLAKNNKPSAVLKKAGVKISKQQADVLQMEEGLPSSTHAFTNASLSSHAGVSLQAESEKADKEISDQKDILDYNTRVAMGLIELIVRSEAWTYEGAKCPETIGKIKTMIAELGDKPAGTDAAITLQRIITLAKAQTAPTLSYEESAFYRAVKILAEEPGNAKAIAELEELEYDLNQESLILPGLST